MTFNEVLSQAMAMLQQHGRVSYRAMKRQFALDDPFLEDLKYELIAVQQRAVDQDGTVLVWTGETGAAAAPTPAPATSAAVPPPAARHAQEPLAYTPSYLAEKILTSRSALEGERKQVTVLFADLKGSMELLADRDPEEARQFLDPVLERMMAAVHRYEGTVNQVMGDGIMALFGAPIAHEDHALRAGYAALAMQAAIRTYAEAARRAHGITVQMRIGLNSGAVVVRAIGNDLHMDYSAVGQTTHLAARMEQLATLEHPADGRHPPAGAGHGPDAVGSFEQALRALRHLPEQHDTREQAIDLRLALRTALQPSGDFGRILACLREAEALAAALDDPRRLGRVSLFLSVHFRSRGVYDQAIALGQRALALATASGEVVLHALANQDIGLAYQAQSDYRRAIDCYWQTVASLDVARRRERFGRVFLPAVFSRAQLAVCHAELGTFAEGRAFGEEGLRIAEAVAHPGSLVRAYHGLGLLAFRQGDLPRTLPRLERAVGLCQDVDLPVWFLRIDAALGAAYTLSGRVADAVSLLTRAMEQATAMERVDSQALCRLSLGEAQVLAGRLEEAHALAEQALRLAREHQERGNEAYALRLLGETAAHRAPPDVNQAATHYRGALALAEALGMRPLQAHCHRGLGTLYAAVGQREQARAALATAIEMYRAMDMTFWLPQAEAVLAQVV